MKKIISILFIGLLFTSCSVFQPDQPVCEYGLLVCEYSELVCQAVPETCIYSEVACINLTVLCDTTKTQLQKEQAVENLKVNNVQFKTFIESKKQNE